ncbi:FecR protein [Rosistilla carotiformis]|uniref:FecR protein n=1 Tax=Rosistilla carotiformis TaxID=2528017 RepID=A0A518JP75_9BACT|nr:LamG-like jellyroll fold domain-containing protein [Rosistilla carotiformis]QDV67344.1 FecR protein [Rosistilla carotiformis]
MNDPSRWQTLANAMINGTASGSDAAELSSLLRDDPARQREYLEYFDTHATLSWKFRDAEVTAERPQPSQSTRGRREWLPWVVAIAATFLAILSVASHLIPIRRDRSNFFAAEERSRPVEEPQTMSTAQPMAMLMDQAGARFEKGRAPTGTRFQQGDYKLLEGVVHLRFTNGTDLVVQSPSEFRIESPQHFRLAGGRVRGMVPPTAKGFTIVTAEVEFVDVGTEFAVRVGDGGQSMLHVFDGQVNVLRSNGELMRSVFGGESVQYHDGNLLDSEILDLDGYQTPEHIGFMRWREQRAQMLQNPGLIAWYPFVKEANGSILTNIVRSEKVPDGRIAGARWVAGRWPGKEALLFDRDSDFVQLNIPVESPEISVAAWIKSDRYENEMNAILNSNATQRGGMHFQLTRFGLPRGGIVGFNRSDYRWVGNPVPQNKWCHVVSIASFPTRKHSIYVNGSLVTESMFRGEVEEERISLAHCRLGNWLPPATMNHQPSRSFRGRIDDLAIWNRALTREEILAHVQRGRPSLLWQPENPTLNVEVPALPHAAHHP